MSINEKWIHRYSQQSVFINLLLCSISAFYLLCRLAEFWHEPLVAALAIFMSGVMVMCAAVVVISYDGGEFSPLTLMLLNVCCGAQLCGLLWRVCSDVLSPVQLVLHVGCMAVLSVVVVYLRYTDYESNIYLPVV